MLPRVPQVLPARSLRLLGPLLLVALVGCVGSIDKPEQFGPAPECRITLDVEDLFRQRCGTGTCHGNETPDPAAGLDLVSPDPGPRIMGTMSTICEGRMRINPARPDDSFLLEKLEGPREGCGDRMPLVGFLDQAEMACVRDWVREQARLYQPRDGGVGEVVTELGTAVDMGASGMDDAGEGAAP